MGLLDSVVSAVTAQVGQQLSHSMGSAGGLERIMGALLSNDGAAGGLSGLVAQFEKAGLGEVIASWIGTGHNLPISADQLQSALGSDRVSQLTRHLGSGQGSPDLMEQLAQHLPGLIDQLTPQGQAPSGGLGDAANLMGLLGGLLGGNGPR